MIRSLLLILIVATTAVSDDYAESTLTKEGDKAPDFSLTSLDGREFSNKTLAGKVVLLNFFATWCGPCMAELPEVEKQIWHPYRRHGLVVLAVGREHSAQELLKFNQKKKFSFFIAADPERKIYSKFATKYIPRTYLIDRDGTIVFQSIGYEPSEFEKLKQKIADLLSKGSI